MNFKQEIANILSTVTETPANELVERLEIPANKSMGDFAFPCFSLAKTLRKAPPLIAKEIGEKLEELPAQSTNVISKFEVVGGYVNFYLNTGTYAQTVLAEMLDKKADYGNSDLGVGKTIVIDYSSPNIAKPFHIGHLRSTVIGNALYNIHKTLGYECVGVNHLGDWGTQFGKLIVAYKKWGDDDKINALGVKALLDIYVKFHDEAEEKPELNDEARSWFVKMQDGDDEALKLWKWFYDISLLEFKRVYDMLGVEFDAFTGESFYNDKMQPIVDELKDKNLLVESEGAMIVDLEDCDMSPCLIIRKDGGTLYATRDITAALYRKNTYSFHKCLYLTAIDQKLHFAQVFEVVGKMGYEWKDDLVHVPFGLVSLKKDVVGGDDNEENTEENADTKTQKVKLSTRGGNVVLMEELLNEAIAQTKGIIDAKNPNLEDKDEVARKVGVGAVIFNDLYNGRIKDVLFSWERMLNFDGETGPYVQYTFARTCSILDKAEDFDFMKVEFDYDGISDESSLGLIKALESFPDKIKEAAERYEPYILTRHLVQISQQFNKFYHDNPILSSEDNVKATRLAVVSCVQCILEKGLAILGIEVPRKM